MKRLKCSDVGFDCDHEIEAETEQAVLQKAAEHAKEVHNVVVTPDMAEQVKAQIRDDQGEGDGLVVPPPPPTPVCFDKQEATGGIMSSVLTQLVDALQAGTLQVVDLTQPLSPSTPVIELPPQFGQSPGLTIEEISRYDDAGPAWYWNVLHLGEHTGTHFDAPVHWVTGKDVPNNTTDTIPPEKFVGPACVIDVVAEVEADPDFLLQPDHIEAWEEEHGRIPAGSWVFLHTDWSKRTDPEDFFNADEDGPHTPGFHKSASELLAHERDILGVGVETVGTDAGMAGTFDPPFPNHAIMHGAGNFGLASLVNLDKLPATGAIVMAAPLKIVDGSGSPVRVLAIAPA